MPPSSSQHAGASGENLENAEKASFGFGHSGKSALRLLHRWGVPLDISMPVYFHHTAALPQEYGRQCATVTLANLVAHWLDNKQVEPDHDVELLEFSLAELKFSTADLTEVSAQTEAELESLKGMFGTVVDFRLPGHSDSLAHFRLSTIRPLLSNSGADSFCHHVRTNLPEGCSL